MTLRGEWVAGPVGPGFQALVAADADITATDTIRRAFQNAGGDWKIAFESTISYIPRHEGPPWTLSGQTLKIRVEDFHGLFLVEHFKNE